MVDKSKLYAVLLGIGYFALVVVMDYFWFNVIASRKAPKGHALRDCDEPQDEEAVSVIQKPLLQVGNVHKTFGSLRAVKGVSFECSAGEVFGLLGTNSAGKTTTVKIAVGELGPDSGDVYIDSVHVHSHLQTVRQKFGYCAQHDALFEDLTVKEHLRFYAAIRGIPHNSAEKEIETVVNVLGLSAFVNTRGGKLSGGNKRKLSLAMAAVGGPAVLFLDEPSSGMDPLSQRFMWDIIKRLANARRTIVLTTHSMEEAEAVSDRVGIMMTGQFKCIGTLLEIKSTYGSGYELVVQAVAPRVNHINSITTQLAQRTGRDISSEGAVLSRNECVALCRERSWNLAKEFEEEFAGSSDDMTVSVLVEWLAENEACDAVNIFLVGKLVSSEKLTKTETVGLVQKYIITQVSSLASIFHILEAAKTEGFVSEYSLGQFSLEQIFNNFAREDAELRKVKDVAEESD